MKVLVVTCSPNESGLTAACGEAARQGVVDGRSPARVVDLSSYTIERCAVCADGWGPCRTKHECCVEDDFGELQGMFGEAEAFVWVTPVYFGEPSETFKAFFDRLRRCEATKSGGVASVLAEKPTICVAAAGGSGNGAVLCLAAMERLAKHLGAATVDFIPVTQRTREYQLETIHDALVALCTETGKPARKQELPISARKARRSPHGRSDRRGHRKSGPREDGE
ncbi:MAG: flavodoxin family protein [Candidatus Bipolaricaulis sp.]|nr:flavodoxin family protein [Candidatus Bipolaricaulis sp.]